MTMTIKTTEISCLYLPRVPLYVIVSLFFEKNSKVNQYSLMIVVDRCGIVVGRCGSLWIVVGRCGSLWVVPGFSNYGTTYTYT